jgi:DNA polymerase III subunit alpha
MISGLQRRIKKDNGAIWAIATLEDLDASIEVLFFPKTYELYGAQLAEDTAVAIKGRVNYRDDGAISVIAMDMVLLDITTDEFGSDGELPIVVAVPAARVTAELAYRLRRTLEAHPGSTPVQIKLLRGDRTLHLALDHELRVERSGALMGDLKHLLGAGCISQ